MFRTVLLQLCHHRTPKSHSNSPESELYNPLRLRQARKKNPALVQNYDDENVIHSRWGLMLKTSVADHNPVGSSFFPWSVYGSF